MEGWKTYKLGDIAQIKGGKRLPKGVSLSSVANSHPYIRIRDLGSTRILELNETYEYVDDDTQKTISRYIVNRGDILLSIVGTIGLTGIVGDSLDNANLTENCVKIVGLQGLNSKFLYYFLRSQIGQNEIQKGIVGAVQPKLPIKNIQDITITIPSLIEQERIVGILSSIDDKIELNNRINHNLEEQAQALFKSWFVDFEPFTDRSFVDSELGMIPDGWTVVSIQDLSDRIASGGTPKSMDASLYNGPIKWFTTKELKDNFLFNSEKHISNVAVENSAAKFFPAGSVLMAIYASPTVGRLGILTSESTFNQAAVSMVPKQCIGSEFLFLLLLSERNNLNNLASGAAQQNLNVGIVKNYPVLSPPIDTLNSFNNLIKPIFNEIKKNSSENCQLVEMRDSLLPILMKGEIAC